MKLFTLLLALLALFAFASAQQRPQPQPILLPPVLEDRAQRIGQGLRCPICQGESIATSPSDLAAEMMNVVRAKVRAGETPAQINAYFVSKYGEWILLSPRAHGVNWLLWLGPPAALLAALALLVRFVRAAARQEPRPVDPALLARVRQRDHAPEQLK